MTDRKAHLDTVAVTSLVLCCALWGLGQVAAKVALAEIPPLLQAGGRCLLAAMLVTAWAAARRIPLWRADGTLGAGLLAGALFGAEFSCIFLGLQYTTASRMSVFLYLSPFVVALGMHVLAPAERLRPVQWVGLLAAFLGVAWAFGEGLGQAGDTPRQWIGDLLGVAAAVLWGATTLVIRVSKLTSASAEKTLFYQLAVAGVLLFAAAGWQREPWPSGLSPMVWSSFIFQVVVVTFASYLVWFWLVRHYPATRLVSFTLLTPVFGLLAGALLLDEPVTLRLLVALVAVAAGIVLVNRRA